MFDNVSLTSQWDDNERS